MAYYNKNASGHKVLKAVTENPFPSTVMASAILQRSSCAFGQ